MQFRLGACSMIGGGGCTKKQTDRLTVEQQNNSPPVLYRASSPLEPLPKRHLNCLETSPGVHGGPWDPHHWIFRHVRVGEITEINGTLCACDKMKENRLPKGNMWSAIPVALLLVIVNWSERKQGSGPEGDKVL